MRNLTLIIFMPLIIFFLFFQDFSIKGGIAFPEPLINNVFHKRALENINLTLKLFQ